MNNRNDFLIITARKKITTAAMENGTNKQANGTKWNEVVVGTVAAI